MNLQKDLWAALAGSDPKEMKIIMGGRQVGKSVMAQMWNQVFSYQDWFSIIDKNVVDNSMWYTVKCSEGISIWLRQQPKELHYEHINNKWEVYKNIYDIHEKIYTMLQLKYGDVKV